MLGWLRTIEAGMAVWCRIPGLVRWPGGDGRRRRWENGLGMLSVGVSRLEKWLVVRGREKLGDRVRYLPANAWERTHQAPTPTRRTGSGSVRNDSGQRAAGSGQWAGRVNHAATGLDGRSMASWLGPESCCGQNRSRPASSDFGRACRCVNSEGRTPFSPYQQSTSGTQLCNN